MDTSTHREQRQASRRHRSLQRLRDLVILASLLATAVVTVDVAPAQAASTVAVEATQVHQGAEINDDFRHWLNTAFEVQVANGPITNIKVQVEAYRSTDDPAVDSPYFSWVEGPVNSYSYITNVDVPAPPNAFQSGLSFQWRARWWKDGDGGNPSNWSSFETFSVKAATGRPGAPYPLSPSGPIAPDNNILRVEQSRPEQTALTDPITEYMVEIKLSGSTEVYWETIVPAPASPTVMVEFDVPNLPDDTKFKWRAYARTASATDRDSRARVLLHAGGTSKPQAHSSKQRSTTSPTAQVPISQATPATKSPAPSPRGSTRGSTG